MRCASAATRWLDARATKPGESGAIASRPSSLFAGEVHTQESEPDEQRKKRNRRGHDEAGMLGSAQRIPPHSTPEHQQSRDRRYADHEHRCKQDRTPEREVAHPHGDEDKNRNRDGCGGQAQAHGTSVAQRYARARGRSQLRLG